MLTVVVVTVVAYLNEPTGLKCDQFADGLTRLRLLMFAEVE